MIVIASVYKTAHCRLGTFLILPPQIMLASVDGEKNENIDQKRVATVPREVDGKAISYYHDLNSDLGFMNRQLCN